MIARSNVPKGHGEHGNTPPTLLCIKKKFLFLTIMDFFKQDHLVPLKIYKWISILRTKIDLCDLDLNVILEGLSFSPLSTIF